MMIIRKKLTPDELTNPTQRYDATCNCTQSLIGDTWVDNPNIDPRTSTALQLPLQSPADPRCNAATGIINNFRDGLEGALQAINATTTATGGASFLLTFLDFLDGVGLLIQLIVDFCALIVTIGTDIVAAGFTSDVYDALKCIIYCNMSADGSINQDQLNAIDSAARDQYGEFSTQYLVFAGWIEQLGFVGLTNVGTLKGEAGDCSDCHCCDCADYTVPTGADWTQGAFVAGDTNVTFFDELGMYTSIRSGLSNAIYIDMSAVVAAGSDGWCVSGTATTASGATWFVATDVGDADHAPSGILTIEIGDGVSQIVPADHPYLFAVLPGGDEAMHITGWCIQAQD